MEPKDEALQAVREDAHKFAGDIAHQDTGMGGVLAMYPSLRSSFEYLLYQFAVSHNPELCHKAVDEMFGYHHQKGTKRLAAPPTQP